MNFDTIKNHITVLEEELMPALGCTEPIAVAFAAAKTREVLGAFPEHITVHCSGNIIKNVKSVTVPNSNGLRGIDAAAILGIVGGCADKQLEVLDSVEEEHIQKTQQLLKRTFFNLLYVKNKRDSVIIYCIKNGYDIIETNIELDKNGFEPLE